MPQVVFETPIPVEAIHELYPEIVTTSMGEVRYRDEGMKLAGRLIKWTLNTNNNTTKVLSLDDADIDSRRDDVPNKEHAIPEKIQMKMAGKRFRRLSAERDIVPEPDSAASIPIRTNGSGLTNAIQRFLNRSELPREIVQKNILYGLNTIFSHDATFTEIVCRLNDGSVWEIFLSENEKNLVPLSQSGSGIKTVLSVLACLFLVPAMEETPLGNYVFAFEELENSVHPALLRRLVNYVYELSKSEDFIFFLTTHSSVLIDQFSKRADAQIVHVTQKHGISSAVTVKTYIQNNGILDDLDVRASDLLQANGIIWVEGPSDRIYLNHLSVTASSPVDQYKSFFEHLNVLKPGAGDKYIRLKPLLAEKLVPLMTKKNLESCLGLDEQMKLVCERIRSWNN
ncbi:ATP-dependent nuclease [Undibacterium sp. TC9W]|uniref:ATP-dependent nuclease n=1 Tax=Undibacterium sp. TC9W TaxID=3413053 RepID=UPI003BF39432